MTAKHIYVNLEGLFCSPLCLNYQIILLDITQRKRYMVFWVIFNFIKLLLTSHYGSRLVSVKTNDVTTRMLQMGDSRKYPYRLHLGILRERGVSWTGILKAWGVVQFQINLYLYLLPC